MTTPAINITLNVKDEELAVWLQVMLAITVCVAALLLLTCLMLCCMRLCGCWTGNILGFGGLRRISPEETDHMGCWCCRPPPTVGRVEDVEGGPYVIQLARKDMSRVHR